MNVFCIFKDGWFQKTFQVLKLFEKKVWNFQLNIRCTSRAEPGSSSEIGELKNTLTIKPVISYKWSLVSLTNHRLFKESSNSLTKKMQHSVVPPLPSPFKPIVLPTRKLTWQWNITVFNRGYTSSFMVVCYIICASGGNRFFSCFLCRPCALAEKHLIVSEVVILTKCVGKQIAKRRSCHLEIFFQRRFFHGIWMFPEIVVTPNHPF